MTGDAPKSTAGPGAGNVMLSAAGRRVSLLRHLEESVELLGLDVDVIATDINRRSAAFHAAARSRLVPPYSDPDCLMTLIEICRDEDIGLIVPTIDPDLRFYAEHRDALREAGIEVMLSARETVEIAADKVTTHSWLKENDFPTVWQIALEEVISGEMHDLELPVFVKPRRGSSSVGARVVRSTAALRGLQGDLLVQSVAAGREYTVDVYVDRAGRCRCAVPRQRLETRSGEVSKGMAARVEPVRALAVAMAERLPGARGVLNIQIFHDSETGELCVIEINPRFGGGYPLSHHAGAHMTRWMLEEHYGFSCTASDETWEDGVVMLRYDDAVFTRREAIDGDAGKRPALTARAGSSAV